MITEVKVFVASPSDVSEERMLVRQIVESYSDAIGPSRGIHLRVVGWEDAAPDLGDPQNLINKFSEDADLVVVIFYRRFGSPTTNFPSGTLEEFTLAQERWQKRGTPRLMLYFKDVDQELLDDPGPQLTQVLRFRAAFEKDRTGLYKSFSNTADFEAKFRQHLLEWLEQVPFASVQEGFAEAAQDLPRQSYLKSLVRDYEKASWRGRAVALRARTGTGQTVDLGGYLQSWTEDQELSILFLLGGFGSGKTWTLKKLAHDQAKVALSSEHLCIFPIFVPLPKIAVDLRERSGKISPELEDILNLVPAGCKFLLLLDGLDEACFASDLSPATLLRRISLQFPENSLWIVACRPDVYRQNPALKEFSPIPLDLYSSDRTEGAIASVLTKVSEVVIEKLTAEEANAFLESGPAGNHWNALRKGKSYSQLTRYPVMLQLLEKALPGLPELSNSSSLEDIYEKALRVWMMRDVRCRSIEGAPELLETFLAELAKLSFHSGATTKSAAINYVKTECEAERCLDVLVNAEILSLDDRQKLTFSHHSFLEYFFARALAKQIQSFDASLLARSNLVFAYQVNRFLVPMLRPAQVKPSIASALQQRLLNSARPVGSGSRILADPVRAGDFRSFMRSSGWRRDTGFGVWGALASLDGTPPVKGESAGSLRIETALHDSVGDAVTGVSWYDAFQFCRWVGGRLPFKDELDTRSPREIEGLFEWTQDWFEEEAALMTAMKEGSEPQFFGANPDLRASNLSFRVVFVTNGQ